MDTENVRLQILPPDQARQHDDTQTRGHYRVTLRNPGAQTASVRIVYALGAVEGRGEHAELALSVEPGETRDWEGWLSLWSRFDRPQKVEIRARLEIDEREYEVTRSFEVEPGERPRAQDPARINMPAGGTVRGEV